MDATTLLTNTASHYTHEVSLAETLQLDTLAEYAKQATGEKFLITPQS